MNGKIHPVLESFRTDRILAKNITRWEHIPAKEGDYRPIPEDLHPALAKSLESSGIGRLYNHQEESYRTVRSGKNLTVVTPTASGKTLCYNLPVLQGLLENSEARALYIFPTKALSQDQQSALNGSILTGELPVKVATYDGDTPSSLRIAARNTGRIIITNPDMLHAGILPNHPKWITFLKSLSYIVLDEVHTYRGIFGSHLTNVIRRLKRIVSFYGSKPVFICCSATIGNPQELSERVIEEETVLVDRNGAPSGEKHLIMYNPPLIDQVQGLRRGVTLEAQRIALHFLKGGVKTIIFSRSRVRTEIIASYINKSLANHYTDNHRIRVESYRGGYLPKERRAIEKGLRDGSIHGVVSTNALELGIDIGGLDAAVLGGFPGSISSAWQQAGRAGRRNELSAAVMVASSAPLDQYMVEHPGYFLSRSPESAYIDPDNPYVYMDHLKCAVFELPFKEDEDYPGNHREYLDYLEESGVVRHTGSAYYWSDRSYPAEGISLRSATSDNVVIVDTTKGRDAVIGEMDRPSAKELIFDNAIYIHRGKQYVVLNLDLENRRCYVEETSVNYFTDSLVKRDIKVLMEEGTEENGGALYGVGDILVRTQAAKFKKIRFHTHENVGYGNISLDEEEMHTRALIIIFRSDTAAGAALERLDESAKAPVLSRLGTLVKNVAPFYLLCDSRDLGIAERVRDPHFGFPALYIYDMYPGGTGLSEGFKVKAEEVLRTSLEILQSCGCKTGCPSCAGPPDEAGAAVSDPKGMLSRFLTEWLDS
ncbi:MAG: DEAD/DEAH box helicase [Spirochaetia bacterium]